MAIATEPSPSPSPSPQLRRDTRHHPSPWSHVVRGEPEAAAPPSPSSEVIPPVEPSDRPSPTAPADDQAAGSPPEAAGAPDLSLPSDGGGGDGSAASAASSRGKKPAWNRLSNGVVEVGAVMGAVSWPALSEAAKASPRSSASDSGKGLSDGSASAAPAPANAITSSPPRQITKNTNFSSSARHASPTRQKSAKHCGSSSGGAITNNSSGALANGSAVPPTSAVMTEESLDKPVTSQPSSRDSNNNWDHGSRGGGGSPNSHGGNEHQRNYGSNRRGNNGGGGGAPYHNNFANRRGMERGGSDWNRSFSGGRDLQGQQQQPRAMTRPFLRPPPPGSAPFISPPPPVRPFSDGSTNFADVTSPFFYVPPHPSPESHGGMPFVGPPAMFYAAPDAQLRATLAKQIDYYFSPGNLCKDIYLRQNMDEEGWVSISLIASFNRVSCSYPF
ncbi:hypothetical protein Taro_044379 [Colocasia esculenta]|uniref:HTH La-type RNA-binding domain-containing protein n=1 Tax=Colocasia esculenta TaxID=4460 RepID=A0A843WLS1_COLES|nr:hypothetical protein [Colocasia esculenta]